ncbi:MAG: DUF2309 domain-containing protein [Bryobacterales bacterium]|nr:DUF2309 domain-containing protein [Bryobacterales bacterium]
MTTSPAERLAGTVEHLAHLLPAQGPIGVFVHHNTLHAFEHLPFEEAVRQAGQLYGAEPYLSEDEFRRQFRAGRIEAVDVDDILAEEPDATLIPYELTRRQLRRAILLNGRTPMTAQEVRWWLNEGRASADERRRFAQCLSAVQHYPPESQPQKRLAPVVDSLMIRLCSAYLDQGVSHWPMGDREAGFLTAVRQLLAASPVEPLTGIRKEFGEQLERRESAEETILRLLALRQVGPDEEEAFLQDELMALPGWAGLIHRLECEPDLVPHERVPCSLIDYLAVRLSLRRYAPEESPVQSSGENSVPEHAAILYAAVESLSPALPPIESLGRPNLDRFREEVFAFDSIERRRVWHLAYERRHEKLVLGPLVTWFGSGNRAAPAGRPAAQVITCIDEREESFRRHLEETRPEIETFGAAGFFGVAMDYAGIDDAHGVALCPVVAKPRHAVREVPVPGDAGVSGRRKAVRRLWARIAQTAVRSTQSLWLGWLSTAVLGIFSLFPLLVRVLAPRTYGRLRAWLNAVFLPVPRTEVTLMRTGSESHGLSEGLQLGFTTSEKVERVASVLGPAGLAKRFARIVLVLGHGSTSLNNPHESAHDCGACGGRRGGPNARLFAAMANRPAVRDGLRNRGITIPEDTWFVGGYHDTSSDDIELYDLEDMPPSHGDELARLRVVLDAARAANALERIRRFESASAVTSEEAALQHVEARAEHLAEPRPEYGHCTNAVALVGRRDLTRGLFLDRRWFLVSYDPTCDDAQGSNLERLLAAGGPVCAGISLEYYFSSVDNTRYGCGTKLPHNVTGLVGVMDGHSSDLRTGLPLQMVEIHEPVRILFVIEARLTLVAEVVTRLPGVEQLIQNRWIRVAVVDPESRQIHVLRHGSFLAFTEGSVLPASPASHDWYRGKSGHLPVARMGAAA